MAQGKRPLIILLITGFLLFSYGLMVGSAVQKSATVDEEAHLFRGAAYLKTGASQFLLGHPLLGGTLSALPLLSEQGLELPLSDDAWEEGNWSVASDIFLWRLNVHPKRLIFLGRLPVMWMTLLLGALLFRWGREWTGVFAGILAAVILLLDPNILASGRLITGDLPVTLFFILTLYGYWHWAEIGKTTTPPQHHVLANFSNPYLLLAGVGLGLAVATKFNAVLLMLVLAFWAAVLSWRRQSLYPILAVLAVFLFGWLIIWAIYGFTFWHGFLPGGAYWDDLNWLTQYVGEQHGQYLLGNYSNSGWWFYFPITFILKTPLPTLFLVGWAAVRIAWRGNWQQRLYLLFPPFIYLVASLITALNIGYRYLVPMLPFLFLLAGIMLGSWRPLRDKRKRILGLLVIGYSLLALWVWPDYLSYFNIISGGNGWQALSDSNVDWGQDLPGLAEWQASSHLPLKLSYFGTAYPSAYGLDFEPLPTWPAGPEQGDPALQEYNPADPAPGYYAISVTNLHGVVLGTDRDAFSFFREQTPIDTIGGSIFIYEVPARGKAVDVVYADLKPADLSPELQAAFETNDVRPRWINPRSSFIWPAAGGWLAAELSSRPTSAELASFWPDSPLVKAGGQFLYELPAEPSIEWASGATDYGGLLTLLGHGGLHQDDKMISLLSAWRVRQPTDRPVKIFVHALDQTGEIISQWDGFDVAIAKMQSGDVFVQKHTLNVIGDTLPVELVIGLYDGLTLERFGVPIKIPLVENEA